jgi:hypothetical protein
METKDNIVSATDLNQQVEIWISDDGLEAVFTLVFFC